MRLSEAIALSLQHYQASRFDQAEQLCRQILQQQPNEVAALHLSGLLAAQRQQFDIAIAYYRQVLAQQPDHLEAHNNLGIVLMRQGDVEEAIAHYRQALALRPDVPEILVNLGNALQEKEAWEEAIAAYQQALKLNPNLAAAYKNWGHILRMQGKLTEAIFCHQRSIALKPHDPEAHFGFAFTRLIAGDLLSGFAEYEWRWRLPYHQPRAFPQPEWDGSALQGRSLLLYAEQGLGDTLQFIRYASLLIQQGQVIVECQKPLLRLLRTVPDITVVAQGDPLPAFDLHAPLLSLPRLFKTTLETIPAAIPYLQAVEPLPLPVPPGTRLKVGIAWAGDPKNPINRRRSCPLTHFLQLLEIPGVTLYSLQKGAEATELAQIQHANLIDLSGQLRDFADTAALVQQLDLVVTIDTALAHLVGAIGCPVWVILPFAPDWRWLLWRTDSPWYPTMRLFRQPRSGDWGAVFTQIGQQITVMVVAVEMLHATSLPPPPPSPPPSPPKSPVFNFRVGIGWQINPTLGWGVYGLNLTLQLLRHPDCRPVLLLPPVMEAIANPLHRWQLDALRSGQSGNSDQNFPILCALASDFTTVKTIAAIASPQKIGVVFFENTQLSPEALARANAYECIIAGSTWNAQILRSYGIDRVITVQQGIDSTIFYPAPRSKLLGDRFVIFSGGKLEYRKGQDIAIAAFRQFRSRHPEALLMVAWHNHWMQYVAGMEQTGHVVGLPKAASGNQLVEWLSQNGIPSEAVLDLGLVPNSMMGQMLHSADVAIFPNRAEGGTNLVAMEALACGIPTILSANTGHLDLVNEQICYPLWQQNPVKATPLFSGVEGWGESSVEELVDLLEQAYGDRHSPESNRRLPVQKGPAAAQFMKGWTWEKQTQRLLTALGTAGLI